MFGWPYADVAQECEFLGKAGYMGVKVFPPQESVFSNEWPQNGELNPWYFMYQPTSYKLNGRNGTRQELRDMIQTCRAAGVRVYADAVTNHMTGGGNDVWEKHKTETVEDAPPGEPKAVPVLTHTTLKISTTNCPTTPD